MNVLKFKITIAAFFVICIVGMLAYIGSKLP